MYARAIKRLLDTIGALGLLILSSPLILLTAVAVGAFLGRPVLFRQKRPGLREANFTVLKFRTMLPETGSGLPETDAGGRPLSDGERATRFGNFLRSTSLDELPQLLNILRGDMSFIGPRPLLERYLPYYTERERLRHRVRPGLTGWSQVNGRNDLGWEERLELDARYVERLSFALDMRILARTIPAVLLWRNVREDPGKVIAALDDYRRSMVFGSRL
jgi:undecaprenyl phosphate N,N'-diacetylbacillosamine 1-phosphate transferase